MAKQVINNDEDILSLLKQPDIFFLKEDAKSICDQLAMLFSIASKSQIENEESELY